jgi:ATP-dependent DNA helicase RecQ
VAAPIEWDEEQTALRERLREYRRATSTAEGIPAYRVFPDATLDDLVLRRPSTYDELLACAGIGPTKLERYGDDILGVISG